MRGSTQVQILRLLRQSNGMTRADIARVLQQDSGVISRTIGKMQEAGWVRERKMIHDSTRRGQPPKLLRINKNAFWTLGIDISMKVDVALIDSLGETRHFQTIPNLLADSPSEGVETIFKTAQKILASATGKILGVGITSSGKLTSNGELLYESEYIGSEDTLLKLKKKIKELNAGEVFIGKAGAVYGLPELYTNAYASAQSTIMAINEHLELSLLMDGIIHSGRPEDRASINHFKIPSSREKCICGCTGCLCMTASIWAMNDIVKGYIPGTREIRPYRIASQEYMDLFKMIKMQNPQLEPLVSKAANAIAEAVENLCIAIQPKAVFFPEWLSYMPKAGIEQIKKHLKESFKAQNIPPPKIKIVTHKEKQAAMGAALMVLDSFLGNSAPARLRVRDLTS